jgi:TonB-dependent SusC/RagA subfamily outer membrane receptor
MKHKFLLMVIFLLAIGNMVYAQKVTLDFQQEKLGKVMEAISKQTGKSFSYSRPVINPDEKVSISVKNEELYTALARIIETDNVEIEITDKKIFLKPIQKRTASASISEQKPITGHVSDASGETIIGANVVAKGTKVGTVTDIDGSFSITAAPDAVLVISYLGFKTQEIAVGNNTHLSITLLEDAQSLEEVVVVGFGTQKKINLTGAVGTVNAKDIQNRPVQNVQQALQGLIPGLNIARTDGRLDATPSINIRGTGNLGTGSSAAPLVLIDGVEGNLSYVNPQDIENISVLKDAAASSIYGSRAPFGVILITTKKGVAGKITVNYNNNFRWNAPTIRPHSMDSYSLGTFVNDFCINTILLPILRRNA